MLSRINAGCVERGQFNRFTWKNWTDAGSGLTARVLKQIWGAPGIKQPSKCKRPGKSFVNKLLVIFPAGDLPSPHFSPRMQLFLSVFVNQKPL